MAEVNKNLEAAPSSVLLTPEVDEACVRQLVTTLREVTAGEPTRDYASLSSLPGGHHELSLYLTDVYPQDPHPTFFNTEDLRTVFEYLQRMYDGKVIEFAKRYRVDQNGVDRFQAWGVRHRDTFEPYFHSGTLQLEPYPFLDVEAPASFTREVDDLERYVNIDGAPRDTQEILVREAGGMTVALSLDLVGPYAEVVYHPTTPGYTELPSGSVRVWKEQAFDAYDHLFGSYVPAEDAARLARPARRFAAGESKPNGPSGSSI